MNQWIVGSHPPHRYIFVPWRAMLSLRRG